MATFRIRNLLVQVLPVDCGIRFDSGGCRVVADSEGCRVAADSGGCGVIADSECNVAADSGGCAVKADSECGVAGDSGCTVKADSGGCTVRADSTGCGIVAESDCGVRAGSGCGVPADSGGCGVIADSDCLVGAGSGGCGVVADSGGCAVAEESHPCTGGPLSICDAPSLHCPAPTLDCPTFTSNGCPAATSLNPPTSVGCCNAVVSLPNPGPGPGPCTQIFSECDLTRTNLPFVCFTSAEQRANPTSLADLVTLERQLLGGLKMVARHGRALARNLVPQTSEQTKAVETVLRAALGELEAHKQYVQKREASAKSTPKQRKAKRASSRSRTRRTKK